jgi:UDP-3-O-[3-hydroxymyristoyl] glucosamine N-acyltransferase
MSLTLAQIAELVGGEIRPKDGAVEVAGAAILRDVQAGEITFVDGSKNLDRLAHTPAAAAVVSADVTPDAIPYVRVADVREAFAKIVQHFAPLAPAARPGISPQAYVSPSAQLGDDVQIHPGACVGDDVVIGSGTVIHSGVTLMPGCRIGEGVTIFPNAVLYENTCVGDRSIIHAGAVLGAYGFGYESSAKGHALGAQLGYVEVGCDVEIGACSTVDRGTFGPTTIGDGTKIDNLVQVGHNCRIGKHNLLCSQVGIAGSCTTGDFVVMAGQVGVRDHVTIGTGAMLGAKSGVSEDLAGNQAYLGAPAIPARAEMQILFALQKLPELRKQVRQLEKLVETLSDSGAKPVSAEAADRRELRNEAA